MTDNLRDRIIKAIGAEVYGDIGNSDLSLATRAADAVIAELGLQTHLAKRIINGKPDQWVRRHVTDWEIVDD